MVEVRPGVCMIIGMVKVRIDNHLRVRKADLPPGHELAIKQRLTIPNGARLAAIKRKQWGAQDMPESIVLYKDEGPMLVLPRGFAQEMRLGMEASGHQLVWDDHTAAPSLPLLEMVQQGPTLHDDQELACRAILTHRQGILQAPTGSGKTVVVLEAWRRSGVPGLILVEKAGLARQWRERALEHLGIETGMIGEGEWDEKPLTIAMFQTLRNRELSELWWRRRGFVAADECHHAVAQTYADVLEDVCSRWFVGVTATPLEREWTQPLLTRRLGPIIHIITDEELRKQGRKVAPQITRVHTGWKWKPSPRDAKLVDTKVIYRRIINALKADETRVHTIARTIAAQPAACAQLVTAKQLAYLDLLADALMEEGYGGEIYMMRGKESSERREQIARLADEGSCVIFATVADEGTDIPRLDRLHLTWPEKLERALQQKVGRVLRVHPDKKETIVFDYVDEEGMLANQARQRLNFYRRSGYPIEQERVSVR
jgi:superfamily II DNA or RNA helicase